MFAFLPGSRSFTENSDAKIIKIIALEDGVLVSNLPSNQMLVEYTAPNGGKEIYTSPTQTGSAFDMVIGWKGVETGTLSRTVKIEK